MTSVEHGGDVVGPLRRPRGSSDETIPSVARTQYFVLQFLGLHKTTKCRLVGLVVLPVVAGEEVGFAGVRCLWHGGLVRDTDRCRRRRLRAMTMAGVLLG
jgi:hypothetical protein